MADAITIKALQDASLDAKSLEEVVNGDENVVVTTRLGETYPSVKAVLENTISKLGFITSEADRAQSAADRAEDAYDAIHNSGALQSASIYETIADGLAGVADDEYFWVYPNSLNSIENLTLFKRVDAMTEELLYVQYDLNQYMIEEGAIWETGEL